jgi:alpha-L-arabinofuranosidase
MTGVISSSARRYAGRIVLALTALVCSGVVRADTRTIAVMVDASKTGAPISKYVYGQFLEHLGGIVNDNFWAEMLDDRKFYFPITSQPAQETPPTGGGPRRRAPRRWTAIGGDTVTMDARQPYVGAHSPAIALGATEAHGIQQTGLALRRGASYAGRIVVSAPADAHLTVSLVWGEAPSERQAVTLPAAPAGYHTVALRFVAGRDTEDARLEITGTGNGVVHVGAVSLMPATNVHGFRAEVIAALAPMHSGVYRFPGGNFVSGYDWRDAIGDPDRRPPIMDPVWHAVQPNDVGTDEFLTLCRLLGVDPYITVNAGFGDAHSAADLVEYTNSPAATPMGQLRAANGHPEPYRVKLWGVGNEPWGEWQLGFMPVAQFALKHEQFAKAMRAVDPSITLIGAGAMPDAMAGSGQAKRLNGQIVPDYLSAGDWSGSLLAKCLDSIDLISEHFYSSSNKRLDLQTGQKVDTGPQALVEWERWPATQVRVKYEHYQEYVKRIPGLVSKPVPISLDEWAYIGAPPNSYKVVPAYAWVFHEMFRHSDLYQLGGFTFATAMMSESRTDAVLSPTGLLFKMYRDHFGTIPVAVSGDSPQPAPIYPAGGDQPRVNPGSDTFPLDVSAALSADRKTLTIAVLNPSDAEQRATLGISGVALGGDGQLWRMAPSSVDATITVGQPAGVSVEESPQSEVPTTLTVPPFSVSLYAFPVR